MAKVLLDVVLANGTDKQEFVDSFNAETEADWWNMLGSMPTLLVMNVEEDYIEDFRSHPSVVKATEVPEAFEASTPPSSVEMTKWFTSSTSSSHRDPSGDGEDNAPVQFIYDTNQIVPTDSNGNPMSVGRDDDSFSTGKSHTFSQRWTGKNVDIVTLEAGYPDSANAYLQNVHPDFKKLPDDDDGHSRSTPYWYQCTIHSNMKGTITVNDSDLTNTSIFAINVSYGGPGNYIMNGSDRNGSVSGVNPSITINAGDILRFQLTISGHPLEIRLADGGNAVNDGSVSGNGSSNAGSAVVWTTRRSTRVVPMDWPDLITDANNQVNTNNYFSGHALGVLSAAGGTICGFAKKASLRVLYGSGSDTTLECIQSVIDWHNAKPNNPETGVPNPTILIAEYQYLQDRKHALPIDYVNRINKADGTVVDRPGTSWGTDFSAFIEEGIVPWKVSNPDTSQYEWCVVMPTQGTYDFLKIALNSAWSNGIICINAAGNNGGTFNKEGNEDDTSLEVDVSVPYSYTEISYNNANSTSTSSTAVWYPFRAFGPHGTNTNIDVAAGYNSEDYPGLDGYTNRGKGVDIIGLGSNTWTANPSTLYGNYPWGMFSGTSCATPTVVGKAACMMEEYFWYNGSWPTPDQTKELLLSKAVNKARGFSSGGSSFSWNNVPNASTTLSNEISSGNCNIANGNGANGGFRYTELTGTTQLRAYFDPQDHDSHPYNHRIKHQGKRPIDGAMYPRPNNIVGRHNMNLPDLT